MPTPSPSSAQRDPRLDILFEPVRIGPHIAKNRFYQAPHCNGMGALRPQAHAAMRGVKAEGGWAVINTEHCSIHPTADVAPEVLQTLWDDGDIPGLALMCEAVHRHGALAGIQLSYQAYSNANRQVRDVPMGPEARPISSYDPLQARAMDKADIRNLRRWMADAAGRARRAGFDIIGVDANFTSAAFQFLSPHNGRRDEYGGSLENRVRLLRELIEVTRDAVAGDCAVSVRVIVEELCGPDGLQLEEGLAAIAVLAELPDLWDILVGTFSRDTPTSRFAPEDANEPFIAQIKTVTTKPVVGVGRFTSPDAMASLVRRGILDMIGAARPSIADPFLPRKIEEGRLDDIRECIGCNICLSSHFSMTNLRCTQNPTMGEEWRRGWHPERIASKASEDRILVVGAGPAGLECARALGQRGYGVALAERSRELGGRVLREAALPGLGEWAWVCDWRRTQIGKLGSVEVYLESELTAESILDLGFPHVVLATGARWRADGVGRNQIRPVPAEGEPVVMTPDEIMDGNLPPGPVLVYDDDHYYMASVIAEKLAMAGRVVTLATPAPDISAFTATTQELGHIAKRLAEHGVTMITHHRLAWLSKGAATLTHVHTGETRDIAAAATVMVTARLPVDALHAALAAMPERLAKAGIKSVTRIGDCLAPGAIYHAVYAGHRFAREFDGAAVPFKRERTALDEP